MYSNILVPISFDTDRDAAGALDVAKTLAGDSGRIILVHVMEHVPGYVVSYLPPEHLAETRRAIDAELAEMAAQLPNGEALVVEGHSGRTILEVAEKISADCVVIAGHRPGMQDLLLGSTATQVVRHAKCAVHVVR